MLCAVLTVWVSQQANAATVDRPNWTPVEQSKCEIAAIKFKAAHPRMDMFDKRNLYPFQFGEAWPPEPVPPLHDAVSGITFHVNSDGRHIEAINAAGRKLWVRNPFVDQDLCP